MKATLKSVATEKRIAAGNGYNHMEMLLVLTDANVVRYLTAFSDEEERHKKAAEALKVGVIAIQSASPTLDTNIVETKFADVESRLNDQLEAFQTEVKDELCRYFEEKNGAIPRSIDSVFGDEGSLSRTFRSFFDPTEGRLCRLMQTQIGPESAIGKTLNPDNKKGVIALIEAKIQELVESKLDEVLKQFSLDDDESAMSRMNKMLMDFFGNLNKSLDIKTATAEEANKGHVKGIEFENDLYSRFAELGRQLADETDCVRGTVGAVSRCKKGDYVAVLGETSGAPGLKIAVEVKDQPLKLKAAIDELQEAKTNREAAIGIFVFTRGAEPAEIGDFHRIGEDFYVTVHKNDVNTSKPLLYFEAAYKIARALAVASVRKQAAGEFDIQKVQDQLDALAAWSNRIADMATKARTIQNNGKLIEQFADDLNQDLDHRIAEILKALQHDAAS